MDPRSFLEALAISVLIAAIVVIVRLLGCLVTAIGARRYQIMVVAVVGLAGILAALAAVVVVWFGYAVAHTEKTARTDLIVLFSTVPPFFLVSFGLWLLGGKLYSRLQSPVDRPGARRDDDTGAP